MKRVVLMLMLVAFLFSFGCYTHIYNMGSNPPGENESKIVHDKWRSHWLFGLIDTNKEMKLDELCPSGNITIKDEHTFLNGLVGALIGIVYAPTKVTIYCQEGGKAEVQIDQKQAAALVLSPEFLQFVEEVDPTMLPLAEAAIQNAENRI